MGITKPEEKEYERLPENPTETEITSATKKQLNEFGERSPQNFEIIVREFNRRSNTNEEEIMDTEEDEEDVEFLLESYNMNLKCFKAVLSNQF